MIQPLHIFRKDIRHLWPELSIYVALLGVFAWVTPQIWEGAGLFNTLLQTFSTLLNTLIPIMWLVIIARLVHDESLVGDQQFWITRPYAWASLLGAKLLFLVVCIVLPFVAMQWFLLLYAGLHPLAAIPTLLLTLLKFALILWLPFTAAAAVTSTLQRMFMSLVAAVIVYAVVIAILSRAVDPRMTPPFVFEIFAPVFGGLLIGILLYQYAVRRTAHSRIALVATVLLFLGVFHYFVEGYFVGPANILIRHHYPLSTNASVHLTFDSSPLGYEDQVGKVTTFGSLLVVNLPVRLEGLDPSAHFNSANASFTIDAPGYHYASPWRPVTVAERSFSLFIPHDVVDRNHGTDVRMHLTFVAQRLLPGAPQIVTAADRFSVPSDGTCVFLANEPGIGPICRYSFRSPPPTTITGSVTTQSCSSSGPTHLGTAVIHSIYSAGTKPDPVVQEPLQLGGAVCPGTQLTFTTYHPAGNFRTELDIPAINLAHYVAHTSR